MCYYRVVLALVTLHTLALSHVCKMDDVQSGMSSGS